MSSSSLESSDEEAIIPAAAAPRNSFDRYGDDLAKLLLNYLPVRDLLRWESMSKQVQRCGIRNVSNIQLNTELITTLINHNQCRHDYDNTDHRDNQCLTSVDKFRRHVMQRSPEVSIVDLIDLPLDPSMQPIIQAIVDRQQQIVWPKLKRIVGCRLTHGQQPVVNTILPVQQLFHQLDVSDMLDEPKQWLQQFQRLDKLTVHLMNDCFIEVNNIPAQIAAAAAAEGLVLDNQQQLLLLVNGLLGFRCLLVNERFVQIFRQFIDQNLGLKRLAIDILLAAAVVPLGGLSINQTLLQIGRLKNLRQLDIESRGELVQSIGHPLALIVENCRKLKQFSIRFRYRSDNPMAFIQTIQSIKRMNRLLRLEIITRSSQVFDTIDDNQVLLVEQQLTDELRSALEVTRDCWPRLRRLKLTGKMLGLIVNKQFFVQIYQNMPRLQSLDIDTDLMSKILNPGRQGWQALAQLPQLEELIITGPVLDNINEQQLMKLIHKQNRSKLGYVRLSVTLTVWAKLKSRFMWSCLCADRLPQSVRVIEFDLYKQTKQK